MENLDLLSSQPIQGDNHGDIMAMNDVNEMAKHFLRENVIVWYDPKVNSQEYALYIAELNKTYDFKDFLDWKEASEYLKKETQLLSCQVITSKTNGETFVKEICHLPHISSIYVFDSDTNCHKIWDKQCKNVVKCSVNSFDRLLKKIKSSLRFDLPSFAPIFDDMDLSEMNSLHLYLKGLINFKNRHQAKEDFLALAKTLYVMDRDIDKFEKIYNQYDMKTILNWYTKESFLYRLTNNCLRLAQSDSIIYSRFILKDLETAIKDKYWQHSHNFSGLLYRGAYLSHAEWTNLQQNINRDIEMHGFLSTTKRKDTAIGFCQEDMDKKAFLTIIVPNFPYKGEQGFAELKDHSDFPDEDEVLFNVRSRFTVLEASMEKIDDMQIRHLVLLYGALAMKRFTTDHDPSFEVHINITKTNECQACKKKMNIVREPVIAVNICNSNEYLCKECVQQPDITNRLALLCLSLSAPNSLPHSDENRSDMTLMIEGTVIQYQDSLGIPFYGEKCVVCQGTKLTRCYKCLDCKDAKMIYCTNCFHDQNSDSCTREGHLMILQSHPFSFWSDKMQEKERYHQEYQGKEIKNPNLLFLQGIIFQKTQRYDKSIEYFQKYLEKNEKSKKAETAICYGHLGISYNKMGEYQKAIESHLKCLEICNILPRDSHIVTSMCYHNLGEAYRSLGKYQKATESYSKSLEINKAAFGDKHPTIAINHADLGSTYMCLGEFQKAKESFSKCLEINKVVLGDNHPNTGAVYNNLGEVYRSLGDYQQAIEYSSKSLEINKVVFGDKHLSTAISYNNLGAAYQHLEEFEEAIKYLLKSLEINKVVLGDNHPDTGAVYNNLGELYRRLEDYQKAIECLLKSLEIKKAVFGDKHPSIATCYNNLGLAYSDFRENEKAVDYLSKALEINKAIFKGNHPHTAMTLSNLGDAYLRLRDIQKAQWSYSEGLKIFKAILGEEHPITSTCFEKLLILFFEALGQKAGIPIDGDPETETQWNMLREKL